jgi:hypothetical protein
VAVEVAAAGVERVLGAMDERREAGMGSMCVLCWIPSNRDALSFGTDSNPLGASLTASSSTGSSACDWRSVCHDCARGIAWCAGGPSELAVDTPDQALSGRSAVTDSDSEGRCTDTSGTSRPAIAATSRASGLGTRPADMAPQQKVGNERGSAMRGEREQASEQGRIKTWTGGDPPLHVPCSPGCG